MSSLMNSSVGGTQYAQGPNLTGNAGVPVNNGVTWGNVLNAAQQGSNRNYIGAFNSLVPQQPNSQMQMMPGMQIPQEQKQSQGGLDAIIGLLANFLAF